MAERRCQECGGAYALAEGRPDPKFCSDRCFSRSQVDDGERGSRLFWLFKLTCFLSVIALAMFRYDVATWLAHALPESRPYACRALAWLGGEGIDRLVAMVLEPNGETRFAALAALGGVEDASDAHPRVAARLGDLRNLAQKLDPAERSLLYLAYGACGVTEQIDELISALADDRTMLDALRGLSVMREARGSQPMLDQLSDGDVRFVSKPAVLAELLLCISRQPDTERMLMSRFFPYLAHDSPVVRSAAARAVANEGADYLALKERLPMVPAADQYAFKQRLARVEKGLASLQSAGPAEKEPATRAAFAESVERITGRTPDWGR